MFTCQTLIVHEAVAGYRTHRGGRVWVCRAGVRGVGFTVQRISENDSMQPGRDLYARTTEFSVCARVCVCTCVSFHVEPIVYEMKNL